nr:unnamed protein product [Hydra vulgaris]
MSLLKGGDRRRYNLPSHDKVAVDIDNLICAEIPDPIVNCELYDIIKTCMIHGPCGILNPSSPCMKDGVCSKNYPKDFNANTVAVHNGYPRYRRRDNGLVINIKGHDCANVLINEQVIHDEINLFLDCRYVSAPEALWRIFEYPISHMSHTIICLKVHLPENQIVYFREGEEQVALDRAAQRDTHLTAWFKLKSENEGTHRYSYVDIPYQFVFDDKHCKWKVRQRGGNKVIVRMYKVSPTGELFFLRLLLLKAKGASSWEDLHTVNGIVLETFREACVFNGLLQDDTEWQNTLSEAVLTRMRKQIRQLFSIILTFCESDDPLHFWNTYKAFMMEDFIHRQVLFILAERATLLQIEKIIIQSGKTLSDYNLPVVDEFIYFYLKNLNDHVQQSIDEANRMRPLLNVNQLNVSNAVLAALNEQPSEENQHSRLFFMDGPAGSGKTFTYNYLIAEMSSRCVKSATAAWTGMAATLLTNGSTLHGLFKIPVPILDNSTCNMTPNSIQGQFLRQVSLFMLDETSMIPKHALNAIDRLLKDVCNNNFPFGGKIILFGGDFRQILPVVKRGRPAEVVESCIKCSLQWQWVQKFTLTENMRVRDGEGDFSEWLENESIVEKIFGDAQQDDYAKRVIITPTNVDSLSINEEVLVRLHGEVKTYLSADQIDTDDLNEINNFPVEFLNSLTPLGMPTHCLKLKIDCVTMLLRNLDLKAGLCNGTRMKVYALQNNYIDAEVLTGVSEGKRVFVPRIQLAPSDSNLPFVLKRRQFPVRLAYSMTINKSQGQTFDRVGLASFAQLIVNEASVVVVDSAVVEVTVVVVDSADVVVALGVAVVASVVVVVSAVVLVALGVVVEASVIMVDSAVVIVVSGVVVVVSVFVVDSAIVVTSAVVVDPAVVVETSGVAVVASAIVVVPAVVVVASGVVVVASGVVVVASIVVVGFALVIVASGNVIVASRVVVVASLVVVDSAVVIVVSASIVAVDSAVVVLASGVDVEASNLVFTSAAVVIASGVAVVASVVVVDSADVVTSFDVIDSAVVVVIS